MATPEKSRVFSASEQREKLVWDLIQKERSETDAKTARLKAMRLAKEAEDAAASVNVPKAPAKKKAKRATGP